MLKTDAMMEYSIVIPVFNEEESLKPLLAEIKQQMEALARPYEVIFVNDGSTDRSLFLMELFKMELREKVSIINLPERRGQTMALKEGLYAAQGNIVITLDADLQNDPSDIPLLIAKMQDGYDVVCGWRKDRMDKPLKMFLSKLGNILRRLFSGLAIHDISCTLRAYKKECIDHLALSWEGEHRFIPLILVKQGYRVGEIVSHHRIRQYGFSKYNHKRIFKVVGDFFRVLFSKAEKIKK